jgi:hypothetical protein
VVESAECVHPAFGRHIAEVWDADLGQYVFEFYIHVTPDNDRCINFDRQRVEIKTYDASPDYLKGVSGETVVYKWRFKIPTGFQPSSNFTHIHQVKAVGGDESDPIFVLTARKGTPNKLELNYYSDSNLSSQKLTSVNLSLFENTWVEATERIKLDNVNGTYSIVIKKVSDGTTIFSYNNNKLLTIRADNTFIRPKWGIYRSLLNSTDLRDESLRFNSISINEESISTLRDVTDTDLNDIQLIQNKESKTVTINFQLKISGTIKIEIIDINGRILSTPINNNVITEGMFSQNIDLNSLKEGVYFVRINSAGTIKTTKVFISNI